MALTGEPIDALQAAQFGLVNQLTDPGQALAAARRIALRIVANAPLAVAASKRVILEQQDWTASESVLRQRPITDPVGASEDAREGARAFADKREPRWQGR
jgi:enoyl-CoA hydratase